jgi:hypothetical protein
LIIVPLWPSVTGAAKLPQNLWSSGSYSRARTQLQLVEEGSDGVLTRKHLFRCTIMIDAWGMMSSLCDLRHHCLLLISSMYVIFDRAISIVCELTADHRWPHLEAIRPSFKDQGSTQLPQAGTFTAVYVHGITVTMAVGSALGSKPN